MTALSGAALLKKTVKSSLTRQIRGVRSKVKIVGSILTYTLMFDLFPLFLTFILSCLPTESERRPLYPGENEAV